ncbi:hypothetical protein AGOR_G00125440 [Albula goreensis]|uniref:FH2 domain-containing protein n=1 Tax=Albula goreensis TaxID=1534307 RepID=A0A8T3DGR6_9TELE|nr:hypothetical protein AGOR_G00125440 [Albula goreensis]
MRNFNWDTIPRQSVLGKRNIWTVQKTKEEFELDTKRMEELFSQGGPGQGQKQAPARRSVRGLPQSVQGGEVVSILNAKKNMNIGIFLKQFRRPMRDMVEDIHQGNGAPFGTGKLKELCKLLPEDGEVKQLLAFSGDLSLLSEADLFMVLLVRVPSYEERLKSLVLKEEFFPFMDEMKCSIATMTTAARELLDCDDLHSIIRLVLKTGNYMNAGGYAGSAIGFRMASLLKLVDTKANKPGMNLMHYVVMQAQKIDSALLEFPDQLQHIGAAARIHKQEVETEFQKEKRKVEEAKADASKQQDLEAQMEAFLKEAESQLAEVEISFGNLNSVSRSVAEYFCEDPNLFKLDECCSIFHSFCEKFMRAIQENRDREMAEVKRRQRERLHNATKRRSTATCSVRDKEMEGVALESFLQKFLTKRNSRRRTGTPSPTNCSLTEITIREHPPVVEQQHGNASQDMQKYQHNSAKEQTGSCQQEDILPPEKEEREEGETIVDSMTQGVEPQVVNKLETPQSPKQSIQEQLPRKNGSVSSYTERHKSVKSEGEEEEAEGQNEEEAQKLREVSRKVLLYQNSRSSVSSGEHLMGDLPRSPGSTIASPHRRDFPSESTGDGLAPPRTILSPRLSPLLTPNSLNRRHTLSVPPSAIAKADSDEDDLWMLPKAPTLAHTPQPRLGVLGKMKSVDVCPLSPRIEEAQSQSQNGNTSPLPSDGPRQRGLSVRPSHLNNHSGPTPCSGTQDENSLKRRASGKAKVESERQGGGPLEPPLSFRWGSIFQRRYNSQLTKAEEKPRAEKQETSAFISFFRRLSEKNRPNKDGDSRVTDL